MNPEAIASVTGDQSASPAESNPFLKKLAWFFSFENRYLAPMLITTILLIGQLTYGFLESWWRTALAIGVAILVELILGRLIAGQWPHLASAYISGIIDCSFIPADIKAAPITVRWFFPRSHTKRTRRKIPEKLRAFFVWLP